MRIALAAVVAVLVVSPATAETMKLVCYGQRDGTVADPVTAFAQRNGQYSTGTIVGRRSVSFQERMNVEIDGDQGRIISDRGSKWTKMKDIVVTDTEITASAPLGLMHPKIRISRQDGSITVTGLGNTTYEGTCKKDEDTGQRVF